MQPRSTISCNSNGGIADSVAHPISVAEAKAQHGRAGVEFVDPRPSGEIEATTGRIPRARLISVDDVDAGRLPPVFADRTIRVIVACHAEPVAQRAAEAFARLGFARAHWVQGGTLAWLEAGHPTVR